MREWRSIDVETSGELDEYALQPWRVRQGKAWITTIAQSRRKEGKVITMGMIMPGQDQGVRGPGDYHGTRAILKGILGALKNSKDRGIGWNMTFDVGWFMAYDLEAEVMECLWGDAMRVWQHLDIVPTFQGRRSYRLDEANKKFEPRFVDYKHDVDYHDPSKAAREKLLQYNRNDTHVTLLHMERFWAQLTPEQQRCAVTEMACIPMVSRANLYGMHVKPDAVETLDKALIDARDQVAAALAPHGVTEAIVRSNARLATLLYKKWELPVFKYTWNAKEKKETTTPSTDKEAIIELSLIDARVGKIGMWREALNLRGKFVQSLFESIEYNGEGDRTHPQAIIFGTYTSRLTYSSKQGRGKTERQTGFALHQMKNDKRFRGQVKAPPGHVLFEADAAGQEYRWMAIKSGDERMLELCLPGGDPHSFMAAALFGVGYDELKRLYKMDDGPAVKKRKAGKVSNLSLQYRTGVKRLRIMAKVQHGLTLSEEEALHFWLTYKQTLPGVPIYWRNQIALGKQLGYAETLAGRRIAVEGDWTGEHKWAMESTMINYPIQGTGGEQKYLALRCMKDMLVEYDSHFAWDLHDGIYFYVPERHGMAFATKAKKVLDNLPYKRAWDHDFAIPLPWDVKLGPTWGELVEVKV